MHKLAWVAVAVGLVACDTPPRAADDAAIADTGRAPACRADVDCDDALFCNGAEHCDPSSPRANLFGCVGEVPPCSDGRVCDEDARRCQTACERSPDADGDGHAARECGGLDCDDGEALVHPGALERCDARDDDCDPTTLGDLDADGDGHLAAACCNDAACGDDCDDASPARHPGASELCNGVDDDCDGVLDGPLEDRDRDGHVAPECGGDDCDDEIGTVHPGAVELCDGVDTDCDGTSVLDEVDRDGDGALASACTAVSAVPFDCDDRTASIGPSVDELCNGSDDDCDGHVDEGVMECGLFNGPVQVSVGTGFACARRSSGRVVCWGRDDAGQLGDGDPGVFSAAPREHVVGVDDATDLSAGASHACVIRRDRSIACWGTSPGHPAETAHAEGPAEAIALAAGSDFTCAIRPDQRVACWGRNTRGALGGGSTAETAAVVDVVGISDATALAAGHEHACALLGSGRVVCWGGGLSGELGDGLATSRSSPVEVSGIADAIGVAAGSSHSCALRADGRAWCWGNDGSGQLGDGSGVSSRRVAAPVWGDARFTAIESGALTTCASGAAGAVDCWGVEPDADRRSFAPTAVGGLGPARSISVGSAQCALRADGSVVCRGPRDDGQLGDGGADFLPWMVPAVGVTDATAVVADAASTCALSATGAVLCWGIRPSPWGYQDARPAPIGIEGGRSLSLAGRSLAVLQADGAVTAVGANGWDPLGVGRPWDAWGSYPLETPLVLPAWGAVAMIDLSERHACAADTSGHVRCAGEHEEGQLGSTPAFSSWGPIEVPGVSGVVAVETFEAASHAILADGRVMSWGRGHGAPALRADLPPTRAMSGRCLLDTSGGVWCRGGNLSGEVGDGTHDARLTLVRVVDLPPAEIVATRERAACAIAAGELWCWGSTHLAALRGLDESRPQRVPGIHDAIGVAMAEGTSTTPRPHACVVRATGAVLCWGDDRFGQLGDALGGRFSFDPVTVLPLPLP